MSASREKKIRQDLAAKGITDPKAIRDNAMHVDRGAPDVPPDGVDFVVLDGKLAVRGKTVENARAGRALRK